MRRITVATPKGGAGKTTLAVNLAGEFARKGRRVLLIDLDPQAAATGHLLEDAPARTMADVLAGTATLADVVVDVDVERLKLAAGGLELIRLEGKVLPADVAAALGAIPPEYDYIIIDTPPAWAAKGLALGACLWAGEILIPVEPSMLALAGLVAFLELVAGLPGRRRSVGIVPSRVRRTKQAALVLEALHRHHGEKLLPEIRSATAMEAAAASRRPIHLHAPRHAVAADVAALARAIERKGKR